MMRTVGQVERVLHVARGMLRRHVERFEVVVVVFELGPADHLIPHPRENRFDAVADDGERVTVTERQGAPRQGDVDGIRGRPVGRERRLAGSELVLDERLQLVGELAERPPFLRSRGGDLLQQRGHRAALATEILVANGLEVALRRGACEIVEET
jgi:hypothetical protein